MRKRRCTICGELADNTEKYNGVVRCYTCGYAARRAERPDLFRHHYQQGDYLCAICNKEIDDPMHIPLI